jgi:hypothetical protein
VRTTLSIDDDVASLLCREMRRSGASLKGAVNHFLRLGLTSSGDRQKKLFVVNPRPLGLPRGLSYDSVADLMDNLEDDGTR